MFGGCGEDLFTVMMHGWGGMQGVLRTYILLWCICEVYIGCAVVRTYLSTVMIHVQGVGTVW